MPPLTCARPVRLQAMLADPTLRVVVLPIAIVVAEKPVLDSIVRWCTFDIILPKQSDTQRELGRIFKCGQLLQLTRAPFLDLCSALDRVQHSQPGLNISAYERGEAAFDVRLLLPSAAGS